MTVHEIDHIVFPLPADEIYRRLGRNSHLAEELRPMRVERLVREGFAYLKLCGAWRVLDIVEKRPDVVILSSGVTLSGNSAVKKLSDADRAVFLAVSAGASAADLIESALSDGDGSRALVYDAVAGECTDAAADFVEKQALLELARSGFCRTGHRFSPGYGDLGLEHQRIWFELLPLKKWGIELTEKFIMRPEKTVTAILGVKQQK